MQPLTRRDWKLATYAEHYKMSKENFAKLMEYNYNSVTLSFPPLKLIKMPQERESEPVLPESPAKMLKIALGYATFDNKDLSGAVFSLVDSMVDDYISGGYNTSDTTDSLISDLFDVIRAENEEIQGRLLDEDPDEDEEDEVPIVDDMDEEIERSSFTEVDDEDEDDEEEDEDDPESDTGFDDDDEDDDDDEIIPRDTSLDDDEDETGIVNDLLTESN